MPSTSRRCTTACRTPTTITVATRYDRSAEGFRTPVPTLQDDRRAPGAGVRKPRREETAGRRGRGLVGRDLWEFEKVADGSDVPLRGPEAPSVIGGMADDELFRSRAYEGVA